MHAARGETSRGKGEAVTVANDKKKPPHGQVANCYLRFHPTLGHLGARGAP